MFGVTDVYFSNSYATLSSHRPVEIRSLSVFLLRLQTDGYCTLPGHRSQNKKPRLQSASRVNLNQGQLMQLFA